MQIDATTVVVWVVTAILIGFITELWDRYHEEN